MRASHRMLLASSLFFFAAGPAGGQEGPPGPPWLSPGQLPPGAADMNMEAIRRAESKLLKAIFPELYEFQERLRKIESKTRAVSASYAKKEIDQATAKEELLPLIKEAQSIRSDPDYLVEQRLYAAYVSSPDYAAKLKAVMSKP